MSEPSASSGSAAQSTTAPQVPPATSSPPQPDSNGGSRKDTIGKPGENVRALAFGGGAFDTIMQLGVVHALLVCQGKPPDAVAGLSAGAIQAAAVAEIFQAGKGLDGTEREAARVARLRTFVAKAEDMSTELVGQLVPDMFEIHTQTPLQSPQLPIHTQAERDERADAARARLGLVNLFNALLSIRLRLGDTTRGLLQLLSMRQPDASVVRRAWSLMYLIAWAALRPVGLGFLWGQFIRAWLPRIDLVKYPTVLGQILAPRWFWQPPVAFGVAMLGIITFPVSVVFWFVLLASVYGIWRGSHEGGAPNGILIWGCAVLVAAQVGSLVLFILVALRRPLLINRILAFFDIKQDLGNSYSLKQYLVKLFDPSYYGPEPIDAVVEASLEPGEPRPSPDQKWPSRRLNSYWKGTADPPIQVAFLAADVSKAGDMVAIDDRESLVDGLLAANAVTPLFKPIRLAVRDHGKPPRQAYCIDAVNIANEPIIGAVELLRDRMDDCAGTAQIYSVSTVPTRRGAMPATRGDAGDSAGARRASDVLNIADVALRAMDLQKLQDATFERRLVQLYTKLLPTNRGKWKVEDSNGRAEPHVFVGANVHSIEPTRPLQLNGKLFAAASNDERRRLVREAVAQGCRAAIETFIPLDVKTAADAQSITVQLIGGREQKYVPCQRVIDVRRKPPAGKRAGLPGSDADPHNGPPGPGLAEICAQCAVRQDEPEGTVLQRVVTVGQNEDDLRSQWPAEADTAPSSLGVTEEASPAERHDVTQDVAAPTVNFLFSGGVFRGVFQVGVVNALSELKLRPSVIAGASVGSIMGAMAARAFAMASDAERRRQIARVAATFLGLDRLVLTDRVVDFAGHLGLRAAAARFSPRDVDHVFRQFDRPNSLSSRPWRRVLAGIERLFYLNPFDLKDLVVLVRQRRIQEALSQARHGLQATLERYGVGPEFLGADPLALLISELVIHPDDPATADFDLFASGDRPIQLLAMTTNLTEGKLEVLGGRRSNRRRGNLLQGLLAGSAFPAAFRPRWSREVFPTDDRDAIYVDGGIIDNLPLDALARHLEREARPPSDAQDSDPGRVRLTRRPQVKGEEVPHLIVTASLQPMPQELDEKEAKRTASSWWALRDRAGKLSYNSKATRYANAQEDFNRLHRDPTNTPEKRNEPEWVPLALKVVTVIPRWLCGTFAFHRLLGFSRKQQAKSIAHGCAATFDTFHHLRHKNPTWIDAWRGKASDTSTGPNDAPFDSNNLAVIFHGKKGRRSPGKQDGECWFRHGVSCPFSKEALATMQLQPHTEHAVGEIYVECGKRLTHQPQ